MKKKEIKKVKKEESISVHKRVLTAEGKKRQMARQQKQEKNKVA